MIYNNLYQILSNTDLTEGRGYKVCTGIFFKTKAKAERFVTSDRFKPFAVMGVLPEKSTAHHHYESTTVSVFDGMSDYDNNTEELERQKQLAEIKDKLTSEELALLIEELTQ